MTGEKAETVLVEHDLWWGYLCPALANIGALKDAQRDLVALGADWAEAGRILSRVQSFYVDAAHRAAQRYLANQRSATPSSEPCQACVADAFAVAGTLATHTCDLNTSPASVDPGRVGCSDCGAAPDKRCRGDDGVHQARIRCAQRPIPPGAPS